MPELPADLAAAGAELGLRISRIVRQTDKTVLADGVLADGTLAGQRVAVKALAGSDPFWAARLRHEAGVYQAFAAAPPPVRVPELVYTDGSRLLILEWLDGRPLDDDRYPQRTLGGEEIESVLGCVLALSQWVAPPGALGAVFDYPGRFRRYHASGYLSDADLAALDRLLSRSGTPGQVSHGDPLASNILLVPGSGAALLDWEFAGRFLPGFDLAMLHTQLGADTPAVKARIEETITDAGCADAFAVNLAAVVVRELRIHRELPAGRLRDARLRVIDRAWQHARDRLHRLAGGG
jgi:hypothetical protein